METNELAINSHNYRGFEEVKTDILIKTIDDYVKILPKLPGSTRRLQLEEAATEYPNDKSG